jgi:pyruvate/2-oxoglutarate dehydrogenase complex dihydrolipoamide acyltransferase (E2) component
MRKLFFPEEGGDTILPMEPWRRALVDGFSVAPKPDVIGVWLQDILALTTFRDRYRHEQKVPLTFAPLIIRTCALALRKYPQCNMMLGAGKIVIPSSIDIGIAVVGEGVALDPVVVIRQADTKSLQEIIAELREKSRGAKEQQQNDFKVLNRLGRWLPPVVRRRVMAWMTRNPALRRHYVGTFQVSVIAIPGPVFEFMLPTFLATTGMLSFQGVRPRPIVVDDKVEIRPSAYIVLAGDHSAGERTALIGFVAELQRLLLNPDELST